MRGLTLLVGVCTRLGRIGRGYGCCVWRPRGRAFFSRRRSRAHVPGGSTYAVSPLELELLERDLERFDEYEACRTDPGRLLGHMRCFDERAVAEFRFNMDDPAKPWFWQRGVVDRLTAEKRLVVLKARQIGVTWVGCGVGVWTLLFRPGSFDVVLQAEGRRCGQAGPEGLVSVPFLACVHARRDRGHYAGPWRGASDDDPDQASDGEISQIIGMSSAEASGHGDTCAFALLDEFAPDRQGRRDHESRLSRCR